MNLTGVRSALGRHAVGARSTFGRRLYIGFQGLRGRTICAFQILLKPGMGAGSDTPWARGQANYSKALGQFDTF